MSISLRDLLTGPDLEGALSALLDAAANQPRLADDARLLLARCRRSARDHDLGVLPTSEFQTMQVQLTRAALRLVQELDTDSVETAVAKARAPTSAPYLEPAAAVAEASGEVFISYKWGGESEQIADRIERSLLDDRFRVIRDKHTLGFKADIEQFMARLSAGRAVVCILSHGYLRSSNCMRELVHLIKHPDAEARIFPVVLPDAKIYQPVQRIAYVKFWQDELDQLNASLRTLNSQEGLFSARTEIDLYSEIARSIDPLTGWLKRLNALALDTHLTTNFDALRQALSVRIARTR